MEIKYIYPIVFFLIFLFLDNKSRTKKRGTIPKPIETDETTLDTMLEVDNRENSEESLPWYVQFPEDMQTQPEVYIKQEPALKQVKEDNRFENSVKNDCSLQRKRYFRSARKDIMRGVVMSVILDKPRALKPYRSDL